VSVSVFSVIFGRFYRIYTCSAATDVHAVVRQIEIYRQTSNSELICPHYAQ